jgi:hypothetical protein
MQKKLKKTIQETLLTIIVISLLCGTFNTAAFTPPEQPSPPIEKITPDKGSNIETFVVGEKVIDTGDDTLDYTIHFSADDLRFEKLLGYDLVTMNDCSTLNEIGRPQLPAKTILLALPTGMKATNLQVLSTQKQPIQGTYTIFPAQKPLPVGEASVPRLLVPPNRAIYNSLLPYPSQLAVLGPQTDLAGQSMIAVTIFPLHYLPLQQKLILITSITIHIEGTTGYAYGDNLSPSISDHDRAMYTQMVQDMVVNPNDVTLCPSTNPQPLGVGPGDYDYVIITQENWVSQFQSLADWKTQKGVPATIVTTSWIYNNGGYSGTDVQKIRAFIQDVYNTWGTTYILLGGDTNVVPCNFRTFSGVDPDPVPNDAFYADFDSDWICEVNIGRASVTGPGNGTGQIGNFINKVFTYERNPPLTDYAQKAGFFGFDLDGWTHAQQCKINIKNTFVPSSWTVTTVYDSQSGNHLTNVINALNAGQNLANHADHSNNDCMGTGYVNHDWLLYSADMDALTNGNKQTILYSMGCDPAAFDVSNCIAEHFVRNSNGGGIAFIGNSRYGWYEYGSYDTLSMGYDIHFFQSLFQENLYHLGAAFSDHKNDAYQENPGDDYYQYCFIELTLLGDPELPVWTTNPSTLVVNHPLNLPLGPSSFTVHVQTTGGPDIENAYVCLWKGTEVYLTGYTNAAGNAVFLVSPVTAGILDVTVTKQNYLPAESTAQVTENNLPPYQPSSPLPPDGATNIPITSDLSWTGGDPNSGDTVTYDVYFGMSSSPSKVMSNQSALTYDPGTLNYLTNYHWKIIAWDTSGASTAGPLWMFTTKANQPPIFGTPTPANGSLHVPLNLTWSIPINDPDGDLFSWTIHCSNGQTNSGSGAINGTKSLILSWLEYSTTYTIWVNATDPPGSGLYTRRWYTFTTLTENIPPETTIALNGTLGWSSWYISPVMITLTATDELSGVNYTMDRLDTGSWNLYTDPFLIPEDDHHILEYYSVDNAGNTEPVNSTVIKIDQQPPFTLLQLSNDPSENGWYIMLSFFLSAVDNTSGVNRTFYKIDGGSWTAFTTPVSFTSDGNHSLEYYSVDNAGNVEQVKGPFFFNIDQTPPTISLTKQQLDLFDIKFIAEANDATSGIDRVEFCVDGQLQYTDTQPPYEWTWFGFQNSTVKATAYDLAGNSQSQTMFTPYEFNLGKTSLLLQKQAVLIKQ